MNKERVIEIDIFVELVQKNISLFEQNMKGLNGKFVEPRPFTEWMEMFNNWNE